MQSKDKAKRIEWLDASRGLAILLLIVMHYVGALESRSFISAEALDVLYGILRLATPFFMFTFGLAFYITASKKIQRSSVADYYLQNVLKRLGYILLGREVIVIILSFRYPEMSENLLPILLFQEFSKGGEILIFYFFAFMIAPLNVVFLQRVKVLTYVLTWLSIYGISFYVGSNFVDKNSHNVLRFLFYDIYAFFPFLLVVALAMLIGKRFLVSNNRDRFIKLGLLLGVISCLLGFGLTSLITDNVWSSLANAELKAPPHPFYFLFYLGEVFIVIAAVALLSKYLPSFINSTLSLLGRNTLVSYVLHYTLFASVPMAAFLGGGALLEIVSFLAILLCCYLYIYFWDKRKRADKLKYR